MNACSFFANASVGGSAFKSQDGRALAVTERLRYAIDFDTGLTKTKKSPSNLT